MLTVNHYPQTDSSIDGDPTILEQFHCTNVGERALLSVTAYLTDGVSTTVTSSSDFTTSDSNIVTVSTVEGNALAISGVSILTL